MVVTANRWTLAVVLIALMACGLLARAQAENSPYYVVFETWGLATSPLETGLKIVSFLPERYLLYIDNRDAREEAFGREYLRAVTQDGVNVLVNPDDVSRSTFRERIGTHEVIFNSEFSLCKSPGCRPIDDNAWSIARGDAFNIVATDENGFHTLEGRRDELFRGYISETELNEWKQHGQITRADEPHPRYDIDKRRAATLATRCGELRRVNDLYLLESDDAATERVLNQLRVAEIDDGRIKVTTEYGAAGRMYEFFSYHIEDHEARAPSERFFRMAAAFRYVCRTGDLGVVTREYIEGVVLSSSRRTDVVEIEIDDFGTPKNLLELTDSPYMISINKPSHFFRALEIISREIRDRTLAGYLVTELNRSCRSVERANRNSRCRSYEY